MANSSKKITSSFRANNFLSSGVKLLLTLISFFSFIDKSWSQAFDLDQGENGGKPSSKPISAIKYKPQVQWVNANLGGTNAHYMEGFSVSYRCRLTGLTPNTDYVIRIGFDVRQGGKYALDYITGVRNYFDHTFFGHLIPEGEEANPLLNPVVAGVSSSTTGNPYPIPEITYGNDAQNTILKNSFAALNTDDKKQLLIYNGTITDAFYQTLEDVDLAAATTAEGILLVRFTTAANATAAVLAWGGHIASQLDWEIGNSASAINGSPYHMRIKGFGVDNGNNDQVANGGNTDRSLKTDAVVVCIVDGGSIGNAQSICSGDDPAALTSVTGGSGNGTITYRWESNTTGCTGPWVAIANTNSLTYDPPALTQTTYYRRVTISTGALTCEEASNCVAVTVNGIPLEPNDTYNAPNCDQDKFSVTVSSVTGNPIIEGGTYTILDKNGNAISGVSPASPYVATAADVTTGSFDFSNIPAGSGYSITLTVSNCTSSAATCVSSSSSTAKQVQNDVYKIQLEGAPKVKAAPNPFNDRIRFTLESDVSGQGSLELYNMVEQKVKTVFQGRVEAGKVQTIEYSVPSAERENLIYLFRVGKQKSTGKLIGLKGY